MTDTINNTKESAMTSSSETSARNDIEYYIFHPSLRSVYRIKRSQLVPTEGLDSLHTNYELYGMHMRKEHFFCSNASAGCCPHGRKCRDIHVLPGVEISSLPITTVHRNMEPQDPDYVEYPHHPAGQTIQVFDHRSRQTYTVPSQDIIITSGSSEYFDSVVKTRSRMQQCTHFQRKHCLRGDTCTFLHVVGNIIPRVPKEKPSKDDIISQEVLAGQPPPLVPNLPFHPVSRHPGFVGHHRNSMDGLITVYAPPESFVPTQEHMATSNSFHSMSSSYPSQLGASFSNTNQMVYFLPSGTQSVMAQPQPFPAPMQPYPQQPLMVPTPQPQPPRIFFGGHMMNPTTSGPSIMQQQPQPQLVAVPMVPPNVSMVPSQQQQQGHVVFMAPQPQQQQQFMHLAYPMAL